MDKNRIERIKKQLEDEHNLAIEEKDYSSARQIHAAVVALMKPYISEFDDEYDFMARSIKDISELEEIFKDV